MFRLRYALIIAFAVPGPFDYNGVSHMFYQYCPNGGGQGPGPGGHLIRWGHVAGNLSHWFDFYFYMYTQELYLPPSTTQALYAASD